MIVGESLISYRLWDNAEDLVHKRQPGVLSTTFHSQSPVFSVNTIYLECHMR